MVQRLEPGTVPTASVKCAVEGLPVLVARRSKNGGEEKQGFRHWTIRDYAHAYTSGRLTPTQVPANLLYTYLVLINPVLKSIIRAVSMSMALTVSHMVQVAERFLCAIEESSKLVPGMNLFIAVDSRNVLAQAAAATERYKQGAPCPLHTQSILEPRDHICLVCCLFEHSCNHILWISSRSRLQQAATRKCTDFIHPFF